MNNLLGLSGGCELLWGKGRGGGLGLERVYQLVGRGGSKTPKTWVSMDPVSIVLSVGKGLSSKLLVV